MISLTDSSKESNSKMGRKIKIGMAQINNSFANQNYLPYSIGFLEAYARKHVRDVDRFEFLLPVYKRIKVNEAVEQLADADLALFSTYVWNFEISSEIARRLKMERPEIVIAFGGCQVPRRDTEGFVEKLPFLDMASYGEGERVFSEILENFETRDWRNVPSISFRDGPKIITNPRAERIGDLREVPSPYTAGVFEPLMSAHPEETWIGLWETNRGCPYGCAYCEWGGDYHKRLCNHDLEKLAGDVAWFGEHGIEFIFCCDSNFGSSERDLKIAKIVAESKKRLGFPKALSVQNTKNSTLRSYEIQKVLGQSGLNKGVNLAFQSLNPRTLEAIGRNNISNQTFHELQQRFTREGIETFSDIILGLPEETYESFVEGIEKLIGGGQHNRIQFNNLSLLPNSEMGDPEYQRKYGIRSIENALINGHGSLGSEEIGERQLIVTGTNAMPSEDWVRARAFAWMTSFLYFDKMLQLPMTLLNKEYGVKYREIIDSFLTISQNESPIIAERSEFFYDKARDIQRGGAEFCESREWLNIWWPADELSMIHLCTQEDKMRRFYDEAGLRLSKIASRFGRGAVEVVDAAVKLNQAVIKRPFQTSDLEIQLPYNIWEAYRGQLTGEPTSLSKGEYQYTIDRTSERWESLDEWCKKVVWYGNKKGAYLYSCETLGV